MTSGPREPRKGFFRLLPGLGAVGAERHSWFRADLLAGITVWAMLVPQSLGYATLAGMPAEYGLYAAIGALLLYWLWGSSKDLNVGPESTVAIMMATILTPLAEPGSEEYVSRAAMLAILVGLVLLVGGLLRIGKVADYLSRPVLAGYVFGSGILIIVSQLPDLLGITVDSADYRTEFGAIIRSIDQTDLLTLSIGIATALIIYAFKRWIPSIPGALVALVLFIGLTRMIGWDLAVVGEFPSGVPIPQFPGLDLEQVVPLIGPAVAIALLVYPDSVLTGRSLATINRYSLNANREFFGIGAANIGSGLMGGFPVNGSQSRSFVLSDAGGKSQVANVWAAALALLTLLFLAPLFQYLPATVLAGIVIVAGMALLDVKDFRAIWSFRRLEFWMGVLTAAAVLTIGMLPGILLAVALSLTIVVLRAASPHTARLGRLPGTDTFRDIADHPDARTVEGLLVYRFDAPLFFANAAGLKEDVLGYVDQTTEPITEVVLDAESITDIDSTGAQVVMELLDALDERGVAMVMARVRTEIRDELHVAGIESRLAHDRIYLEVDDAVAAYSRRLT